MPLSLSSFAELRPVLYHLTSARNLSRIRRLRRLDSAANLIRAAGRHELLRQQRGQQEVLSIEGEQVVLRDQKPLVARNIAFQCGWELGDFVLAINERIFFWPGTERRPIRLGRNHFLRYAAERPLLFRIRTPSLLNANPDAQIELAACNSGAPRQYMGHRQPRGPSTFLAPGAFGRGYAAVKEVAFRGHVILPTDVEVAMNLEGPWERAL